MYNVVIIGSGCLGLTAAIYAARASLNPLVIDGHEPGGQLSLTTHVENFPGFPEGIMGPELIENMRKQATKFGTDLKAGTITEVDLSRRPFKITAGKDLQTKTLIVAAGASGAVDRIAERTRADRSWRLVLRDVRRLFLPQPADRGGGRRRFGDGRGEFSLAVCEEGLLDSSARGVSRFENHDRSGEGERED